MGVCTYLEAGQIRKMSVAVMAENTEIEIKVLGRSVPYIDESPQNDTEALRDQNSLCGSQQYTVRLGMKRGASRQTRIEKNDARNSSLSCFSMNRCAACRIAIGIPLTTYLRLRWSAWLGGQIDRTNALDK